jgi:hypothetical protein
MQTLLELDPLPRENLAAKLKDSRVLDKDTVIIGI